MVLDDRPELELPVLDDRPVYYWARGSGGAGSKGRGPRRGPLLRHLAYGCEPIPRSNGDAHLI